MANQIVTSKLYWVALICVSCSTPADCAQALPASCPNGTAPYAIGHSSNDVGAGIELGIKLQPISAEGTYERTDSCEVGCVPFDLARAVDEFALPAEWCGGSPDGSWQLDASCDFSESLPGIPGCDESTSVAYTDYSGGSITYGGGGSYSGTIGDITATAVTFIPESCMGNLSCSDWGGDGGAGWCTTSASYTEPGFTITGTWSVEGTQISHNGQQAEFCVNSDTMKIFGSELLQVWVR